MLWGFGSHLVRFGGLRSIAEYIFQLKCYHNLPRNVYVSRYILRTLLRLIEAYKYSLTKIQIQDGVVIQSGIYMLPKVVKYGAWIVTMWSCDFLCRCLAACLISLEMFAVYFLVGLRKTSMIPNLKILYIQIYRNRGCNNIVVRTVIYIKMNEFWDEYGSLNTYRVMALTFLKIDWNQGFDDIKINFTLHWWVLRCFFSHTASHSL